MKYDDDDITSNRYFIAILEILLLTAKANLTIIVIMPASMAASSILHASAAMIFAMKTPFIFVGRRRASMGHQPETLASFSCLMIDHR